MRISASQFANIVRDPTAVLVILIHGEDSGLVRDRSRQLVNAVIGIQDDPFQLSILGRADHTRLLSEARSLSLTGRRRVVRVTDAGDHLTTVLTRMEEEAGPDVLVILEGGVLSFKSKLRLAVEKHRQWASVSCQPATPSAIAVDLQKAVRSVGSSISADAIQALTAMLPSDSAARAAELDKAITYAGPQGVIDVDTALRCVGNTAELSVPELLATVMIGDGDAADALMQQAKEYGITGASLIAAFSSHINRLLKLRLLIAEGMTIEQACSRLVPPSFPGQAVSLARQLKGWPQLRLLQLLATVKEADIVCKRAMSRDETIAARLLLEACCSKAESL